MGLENIIEIFFPIIQENNIQLTLAELRVIDKDEEMIRSLQRMIHTGNSIGRIN